MEGVNFQRIEKKFSTDFEAAKRYYTIVLGLNDIHVTKSEMNLIAFSAVNGTISTPPIKQHFCEQFDIPPGSIYNMICKLRKLGILSKDKDNKIRVNPVIRPDFSKPEMVLIIKISQLHNGTA